MHLSALLDGVARSSGPEEAVIYRGQRWNYQEFADAARRAATALSEAGLRPGDRLAVMTYNTPAFLFAAFGAWYVGATLVPVNHKLQTPEVAYQLRHCGARLAVVDAEIGDRATAADADVRWLVSHPDTAPDALRPTPSRRWSRGPGRGPVIPGRTATSRRSCTPRAPPAGPRAASTPTGPSR
ncbi:feruloyl-CoA synthase [Streptomyces sp. Ncost-T6T-2b]|nr:feruloyl-CoA synthase [Streptomyces sp. Ncost-T6T-2b]